uniref:Uncharacterized protein n=1 Tax=Plectus sambesii TaxID=2011161 RepID=A0A914UP73_9BILA
MDNADEQLTTADETVIKLNSTIAAHAVHVGGLSIEGDDVEQPSRVQLLAECRLLSRRWVETEAQLQACRNDADENLRILVQLRHQITRLQRDVSDLHRVKSSFPVDEMRVQPREEEESEEIKTVLRFLGDLSSYRGNETGMPKKLRAALESRIKLVLRNARHFSGYISGRDYTEPPLNSRPVVPDRPADATVVPDEAFNSTADTSKTITHLEDDAKSRSSPMYHCRVTLLPFRDP